MQRFFNLSMLLALSILATGVQAECKKDCVVQNRSDDQQCDLENTPLTRCESIVDYRREDKRLNAAYKALTRKLARSDFEKLKVKQRAWLQWRLEKCDDVDAESECDNGVCAGVAHDSCIIDQIKFRTAELLNYAAGGPGNALPATKPAQD